MKRTRVNENLNGDGETSSSTSMQMSEGQNQTTNNKTRDKNPSKKMNSGESSNHSGQVEVDKAGPSQGQGSSAKEASIYSLPPEMLMEIFKCVDTPSLFLCRLVNRQWCSISSGILRKRPVTRKSFVLDDNEFSLATGELANLQIENLGHFLKDMKKSINCPFSHFSFANAEDANALKIFKHKHFKQFLSNFAPSNPNQNPNQRVKSLALTFYHLETVPRFKALAKQLVDLLLHKVPCVEELQLDFYECFEVSELKLFTDAKLNPGPIQPKFQLPYLKVIQFEAPMIQHYPGIVKDLLDAAVNVKKLCMWIYNAEEFQFLHSIGKLDLLKEVKFEMCQDFFSTMEIQKNSVSFPFPKLEILNHNMGLIRDDEPCLAAAQFLTNILESSKDTLKELTMILYICLPGFQLPTFKKLRKMKIFQGHSNDRSLRRIFPPGSRSKDIFPALSDLDLTMSDWNCGFPQEDSIPVLPMLTTFSINDYRCPEEAIPVLALLSPNLKKFCIHKMKDRICSPNLNFRKVGRAIWTHMPKLESLEIDVDVGLVQNNSCALDSCFTGISMENCQRLYKMMDAKKLLEEEEPSIHIPMSKLKKEREYPSILDMKDLETLIINPYSGQNTVTIQDFFTKNLTWISKEHAFKYFHQCKPMQEDEAEDGEDELEDEDD